MTIMIRIAICALIGLQVLITSLAQGQTHASPPAGSFCAKVLAGARAEAEKATPYIMEYQVIDYPGGDVPEGTGVCTDLVVRAFRAAGVDLQKEVYRDIVANRRLYPSIWDKKAPDRNIDHRRCPNLTVWFKRHAQSLTTKIDPETASKDWLPGDVVFYVRDGATHPWHVAIVSEKKAKDGTPMVIDSFPPTTSEKHRLDDFAPIHSHFRMK